MRVIRRLVALVLLVGLLGTLAWALFSFAGIPLKLPVGVLPNLVRLQPSPELRAPILTVALVADSHTDNEYLRKALTQAKSKGAQLVIGLGDYTNVGTEEELAAAKETFASADLPFYVTPGDHDMWFGRQQGVGANAFFNKAFGWRPGSQSYQEFEQEGVRFILLDTADNELGISAEQWEFLEKTLPGKKLTFVLMHETPYHPHSEHIMGRIKPEVASQAGKLRKLLAQQYIGSVITGDLHFFAQFTDEEYNVPYTTIGAVTLKRNPQKPRYGLLKVFEDKSFVIEDTEIERE